VLVDSCEETRACCMGGDDRRNITEARGAS
jgi:hypothetical protein